MDKPNLTVFRVSSKCLSVTEVVSILLEPPVDKISSISPAKPKGGEIYLFRSSTIEEKGLSYKFSVVLVLYWLWFSFSLVLNFKPILVSISSSTTQLPSTHSVLHIISSNPVLFKVKVLSHCPVYH